MIKPSHRAPSPGGEGRGGVGVRADSLRQLHVAPKLIDFSLPRAGVPLYTSFRPTLECGGASGAGATSSKTRLAREVPVQHLHLGQPCPMPNEPVAAEVTRL